MIAVAMLQALLLGFLLAATPPSDEELEERLWDLHIVPLDSETAPAFTLVSLAGKQVSLSDFRGRAVLLYFWATWCPVCTRELPAKMEQVHRGFNQKGLTVVAVNMQESRNQVANWVKEKKVTSLVLLDSNGAVSQWYRVTGTPTVILINRKGEMVGRAVGPREWMGEKGRALFETMLSARTRTSLPADKP
jgi:peroxiredoxin